MENQVFLGRRPGFPTPSNNSTSEAPEASDLNGFLQQFAKPPYFVNQADLGALARNPQDQGALNRISSRDGYVGKMIRQYLQSGGQNQRHDPSQWNNNDFWGGR